MKKKLNKKIVKIRPEEFFSRPGGIAYGAHLAAKNTKLFELENAWAVDNHQSSCETYIRNMAVAKTLLSIEYKSVDIPSLYSKGR